MMKKSLGLLLICAVFSVPRVYSSGQRANPAPRQLNAEDFFSGALADMENALNAEEYGFSPKDVYYLGRAVAANILTVYPPYAGNPELTDYLNRVCQTLVINSPGLGLYGDCRVLILDSPGLNAFASPGGHILITRGLVKAAASEDMLAAVIAHELAHIMLSHGLDMIDRMEPRARADALAEKAARLAGEDSAGVQRLMTFRDSAMVIFDALLKDGYSRSQEFDADREALALLGAAGYDPGALLEILKILGDAGYPENTGLPATHPGPRERAAALEQKLPFPGAEDTRPYRAARFRNR